MGALRLVLGDQLSESLALISEAKKGDVFLLCEVGEEATYVKHHKQKIAFIFSAMRHFAERLKEIGHQVRYVSLDDPANSGSFDGEVARAIKDIRPDKLILTYPGEWRILQKFEKWKKELSLPVILLPDTRFLCTNKDFADWAKNKKHLRMEYFYREVRKKYGLLMEGDNVPTGKKWNFDAENRKAANPDLGFPARPANEASATTEVVINLVEERFKDHFGTLSNFTYAVTREVALHELKYFIENFLPRFGDTQDAMLAGEPYLNHSRLSAYLNVGLLLPLEVCRAAEVAYHSKKAPLNAVEGFIRQIAGWREYVRGIYWLHMPDYAEMNHFDAVEPLPWFFWTAETKMDCVAEAVRHTRDHAYSHHIQRLMVTGNFALLAGLDVKAVQEWYLAVYADAFEWVEMPNTLGMALYGDGGIMASKPYAGSGKYIHRMSNFCKTCIYKPGDSVGDKACPFNALYWNFMAQHEDRLKSNQRLSYVYSTWSKFSPEKKAALRQKAGEVLAQMREGRL